MNKELVIDVNSTEISIALLEDKQLVELNKEKGSNKFTVGDIYFGKIKKIMNGLNACFVDVGYEKDAFLHYLDLGPQFASLNQFINLALKNPHNPPSLETFQCLPDINKNGKIPEVASPGQFVMVQIAKEPISTKGPRITSEISIPGRNLVLIPFSEKVSVSQKIKGKEERDRLRQLILSIKPKNYGVIVRTVAKSRRVASLDAELRELVEKWENAIRDLHKTPAPQLVIGEVNRATAILRDMLNNAFGSINVNNQAIYKEIRDYIINIAPEQEKIVKLYTGKVPIFEHFGVDKQIKSLFGKTVNIKSGAYLIIEHTEALHSIDVNSGNRAKNASDQETNAMEVNMIAAEEIARQLRLRDMGGIIVIDFIDMRLVENKRKVYVKLKDAMASDRAKHSILPLSKFGLMQITRQRVRPEMTIETIETCPTCNGTGEIMPSTLIVDEIENKLNVLVNKSGKKGITLKVHPYLTAFLTKGLYSVRIKWCIKYKTFLKIEPNTAYSMLEYNFFDKKGEVLKEI